MTFELQPGNYKFRNFSESLLRKLQFECDGVKQTVNNKVNDISMKTETVVRPGLIVIKFGENSIFGCILGFILHWDYKHYKEHIWQKNYKFRYNR